MGGEKVTGLAAPTIEPGSPPHGRGKGRCGVKGQRPFRITPAWAGKSQQWPHMCGRSWDHPRMGGEKVGAISLLVNVKGSPPHGRGKEKPRFIESQSARITPAWAGKRQTATMPRTMTRDHPRMGREKTMYFEDKYFCRGSPPRGRGKEPCFGDCLRFAGITPAWAGKRKIQHRIHSQ